MLHERTISEHLSALSQGEYVVNTLITHYLERIAIHNPKLNALITTFEETAHQQAQQAQERYASGHARPLEGIPILHKDIFCMITGQTTCASKMLSAFQSPYNAHIVEQLEAAGAICLGKTNMDEFAMGSSNEHSFYGSVSNPWKLDCVPGGSSGGSAAAMAARLSCAATGTDTGGSIRQPAAFCGITGLKPTYGLISRYGQVAFASSLDQAGPMTANAEDAAHLLNLMSTYDPRDSTCVKRDRPDYLKGLTQSVKDQKIGILEGWFDACHTKTIHQAAHEALNVLNTLGISAQPANVAHNELSVATYYVLAPAEASSNLARYDGIRYTYRCSNPENLEDLYTRTRSEGFGDEVKRRILIGTYVLSAGHFDAHYTKAQKVRRLIQQAFLKALDTHDYLLAPTTPSSAFLKGAVKDPIAMYYQDCFTIGVNLAGLPAITFPAGFDEKGLPIGLQLIGRHFSEEKLLALVHQFQQHTDWHQRLPTGVNA